jgi:hypothetical protein
MLLTTHNSIESLEDYVEIYTAIHIRAGTGPVEIGISLVENFKKSSFLTLILTIKTKISRIFLLEFTKKCLNHMLF